MRRLPVAAALVMGLLLTSVGTAAARVDGAARKPKPPVNIQLITISDWHGQIPPLVINGVQVGGAAALATYIKQAKEANPNTLAFMAGDSIGATPPISSFFEDAPAIQAMNLMSIDADTFGNHNFDRGVGHLQEMVNLAAFPFVAANLTNLEENLSGVEQWHRFNVAGVKITVIGIVNEEAPTLVKPGSLGTMEITDSVAAANRWAQQARRAGADVVVILTHKGIRGFNTDGSAFGELIDFAEAVNPDLIDVIVGDHTDFQYSNVHNGIVVVENRSKGATWARINFTVGGPPAARVLAAVDADVVIEQPLTAAVPPDPAVQAMIDELTAQLAPILGTVIGQSTVAVPRSDSCGRADGRLCESLIGDTVTDAMRATYSTDLAITNSGGLRDALTCPAAGGGSGFCPPSTPPPFPITRGQVLAVLPFGNVVATTFVNGDEVKAFLENGVSAMPGANGRFAQVSGLCFTYEITAPVGSRVTSIVRAAADGSCTTEPVLPSSTYTLAINDFMMVGGDGYPNVAFKSTTRNLMDADVADHITAAETISPTLQGRITCTDANGADAPNCPVALP
jgi:2',3'-cyclic-nucleotide 2'-phosphodiesterase (5'-nucleotidase family)